MASMDIDSLYRQHHGWLYQALLRNLGGAHQAADFAHDAFVQLLRKPVDFVTTACARSYLQKIGKGLCIDHWRKTQLEQTYLQALAAQPPTCQISEEQKYQVLHTLQKISQAISNMPEAHSRVFVLSQFEGLTYEQIAECMGVSSRTVKNYMARAMARLAMLLDEGG